MLMEKKEVLLKQLRNEICSTCKWEYIPPWDKANCKYRQKQPKTQTCTHWKLDDRDSAWKSLKVKKLKFTKINRSDSVVLDLE